MMVAYCGINVSVVASRAARLKPGLSLRSRHWWWAKTKLMGATMRTTAAFFATCLCAAAALPAQSGTDSSAIRATALDYIEGWYAGDAARMERALHPDLAKRIVRMGQDGSSSLSNMTAKQLVEATEGGYGKQTPENEQQKDITILDIFGNVAVVKIVARDWIDYLHIGKFDGQWVIINVLWELKPQG